jgi:hypothetical protein
LNCNVSLECGGNLVQLVGSFLDKDAFPIPQRFRHLCAFFFQD